VCYALRSCLTPPESHAPTAVDKTPDRQGRRGRSQSNSASKSRSAPPPETPEGARRARMLRSSALACWRGAHLLGASTLRCGEQPLGPVELCWSPCAPRMLRARHCEHHPEVALRRTVPLCMLPSHRRCRQYMTQHSACRQYKAAACRSICYSRSCLCCTCHVLTAASIPVQGRLVRSPGLSGGHRRRGSTRSSSRRHVFADDLRG